MVSCQTAPDTRPSQPTRPCSRCCGPAPRASCKVGQATGKPQDAAPGCPAKPLGAPLARDPRSVVCGLICGIRPRPLAETVILRGFLPSVRRTASRLRPGSRAQACRVMPNRSWTPRVHRYSEQLVRRSERLLSGGIPVIRSEAPLWRHDQEITLLLVALNFERHFDISHVLSQVGGVSHCPSCVPETDSCAHSGL